MKKTVVILFIACMFLLSLKIIKEVQKKSLSPLDTKIDIIKEELIPENIEQISVQHNGRLFLLGNQDGIWRINSLFNIDANQEAVEKLVQNFNLLYGELRSSNPIFLKDYDIESDRAIHLLIRTKEKQEYRLLFGRKRHQNGHFVRMAESERVYAVDIDLLKAFGLEGDLNQARINGQSWANMNLVDFNPEEVKSIIIEENNDSLFAVTRQENNEWAFQKNYVFPINAQLVDSYLKTLRNQKGFFIEDINNIDTLATDWTVTLGLKDTSKITINRYVYDNNFYLQLANLPYLYQVSVYHFENFSKSDANVFSENPLKFDRNLVDYMTIKKGKSLREQIDFFPTPIPESLWETVDEMGQPVEPEKRNWKNKQGTLYYLDDAKRILHMIENLKFESTKPANAKWQPYLSISFSVDGVLQEYIFAENTGDGCYPLMLDDHEWGYCLSERSIARLENALTALTENIAESK